MNSTIKTEISSIPPPTTPPPIPPSNPHQSLSYLAPSGQRANGIMIGRKLDGNKKPFPRTPDGYKIQERIGVGTMTETVYMALCPSRGNQMVAIKQIDLSNMTHQEKQKILHDVENLSLAEQIIRLHCWFLCNEQLWIVMDLLEVPPYCNNINNSNNNNNALYGRNESEASMYGFQNGNYVEMRQSDQEKTLHQSNNNPICITDSPVLTTAPKSRQKGSALSDVGAPRPWCHQCKQRHDDVMCCTRPCSKKYCSRCVARHYQQQLGDLDPSCWVCFYCQGICNCACCRRRRDKSTNESVKLRGGVGGGGSLKRKRNSDDKHKPIGKTKQKDKDKSKRTDTAAVPFASIVSAPYYPNSEHYNTMPIEPQQINSYYNMRGGAFQPLMYAPTQAMIAQKADASKQPLKYRIPYDLYPVESQTHLATLEHEITHHTNHHNHNNSRSSQGHGHGHNAMDGVEGDCNTVWCDASDVNCDYMVDWKDDDCPLCRKAVRSFYKEKMKIMQKSKLKTTSK